LSDALPSENRFHLPEEMCQAIVEHARRDAPRECCGIIAGRDGLPVRLHPARNIAEGNALYEIDPAELIELEFHTMPAENTELVAIYHSHPVSPAYPSATDIALAFWPDAIYVICSLAAPEQPVVRGFRIRDGEVAEVNLIP
jgi:[CysO sulfur-carrier protein]-S-L-cysteine hydrolase